MSVDNLVTIAANAHTDLNVFAAVKAIFESGTVYTQSGKRRAMRIINLCEAEMRRQLLIYDRTVKRARDGR